MNEYQTLSSTPSPEVKVALREDLENGLSMAKTHL